MRNKLNNYISIIVLCGLFNTVVGMDQDVELAQLVRKNVFPVLALNNYIVPVSSAYQAFKKEAFLPYVSLQRSKEVSWLQITATNVRKKLALEKKGEVCTIDVSDVRPKAINPLKDLCFKDIQIRYYPVSRSSDRIDAYMSTETFKCFSFESLSRYKRLSVKEYTIKDISRALKNKIDILLNADKPIYIELYSAGNLSDWIVIKKDSPTVQPKKPLQQLIRNNIIKGEIPFVNDEESSDDNSVVTTAHQPEYTRLLLHEEGEDPNLLEGCYDMYVNDDIDKYLICPCFTLGYVAVVAGIFLSFYFSA